jgi:hypothetical protein
MDQLYNLNTEEKDLVLDAYPLIAILIAGADGNIDKEEREWAKKLTSIRSYTGRKDMQHLFEELEQVFESRMNNFLSVLSQNTQERNAEINSKLNNLNPILAELEPHFAYRLYNNYLSFAEHIAKSSGGIFGFGSVSSEEERLLGLKMINVIQKPIDL